jgi:hypothetical protein
MTNNEKKSFYTDGADTTQLSASIGGEKDFLG